MTDPVNAKRVYRSGRRAAQAAETRAAVLAAAQQSFIAEGWQKATIAGIARAARVSAETIYGSFGSKRALLEALVVAAVRGGDAGQPLLEQPGPRAVLEASDQRPLLALFAADISRVLARVAPLMAVVRVAAEAEPELVPLYQGLHRGRISNLDFVVEALLHHGPLRDGLDRPAALATLARLASPELYLLVTQVEGVAPDAYADWLATSLVALLLP